MSRSLSTKLQDRGCQVLFGHSDSERDPPHQLGQIASWFGPDLTAATRLALLDMAIVRQRTDQALVLVEIEESAVPPKVILQERIAGRKATCLRIEYPIGTD